MTTQRAADARPAPGQFWVTDMSHVPTVGGVPDLAIALHAISHGTIGWSVADHLRPTLILDALKTGQPQAP